MICYKDRTYCPFWETCTGHPQCGRALTEEVKQDAHKCQLAISQYVARPQCYTRAEEGAKA